MPCSPLSQPLRRTSQISLSCHYWAVQQGHWRSARRIDQWIGLRENLQEAIDFSHKIWGFPVNFPFNQSIELRFRTADSAFPHDIETYMMFEHVRSKKHCKKKTSSTSPGDTSLSSVIHDPISSSQSIYGTWGCQLIIHQKNMNRYRDKQTIYVWLKIRYTLYIYMYTCIYNIILIYIYIHI